MTDTPPMPPLGSIVHTELAVKDKAKAKKFYGDVFGWQFMDMPEMDYTMLMVGEMPIGGFRPAGQAGDPGTPIPYFGVASVDDTLKKIEAAGGKVVVPKQTVGEMGWLAWFQDLDGSVLGIWQANPNAPQRQ